MNEFNRGIDYAFDYIRKNMYGRVVNGSLEGVITKKELLKLQEEIHKKCNVCPKPCEMDWCCTKEDK